MSLAARAEARTPKETRQLLVRSGVIDEAGELTDHYKPKPRRKPKPPADANGHAGRAAS